jgi:lincosamide nucleotidyltransferase A/C/D/E
MSQLGTVGGPSDRRPGGILLAGQLPPWARQVTSADEVVAILDALERAHVEVSVGGGWGVDALVGAQTRPHGDLDLTVPREQTDRATVALAALGFVLTLDERPTRFVLSHPGGAEVDLHPLWVHADGSARLPGPNGIDFTFTRGSLHARGVIGGRVVRCMTVEQQRAAHAGYAPADEDLWDLALLDRPPGERAVPRARSPRSHGGRTNRGCR